MNVTVYQGNLTVYSHYDDKTILIIVSLSENINDYQWSLRISAIQTPVHIYTIIEASIFFCSNDTQLEFSNRILSIAVISAKSFKKCIVDVSSPEYQ